MKRMEIERKEQGTTRSVIVNLLRRQGQMTAGELSNALDIGAVGVRQHLALLERDGLVSVSGVRRGVGRPSNLYALTETADKLFPKHYDRFATEMIGYVEKVGGEEAVTGLLDRRRRDLYERYEPHLRGKGREEQIHELCRLLNEQGYMCEYERLADGTFVLIEHNCPVDCIAREHPQLCRQEIRLYEDLLGVPLQRDLTIAEGENCCRYRIPA
jgi:predicted ArsR family transcriptional regulator